MKYRVLRPEFAPVPHERTPQGQQVFRVKAWTTLGFATSMADAKRLHPTPVLEGL
jgi:hypothetical protein